MLFPPSKTNHEAVNQVYIAYYPPIIALFISMLGYLIKVYLDKNYFDFCIGMIVFPFVLGPFVVWIHLILDFMLCIINRYGKDSLLDLSESRIIENNHGSSDYSPIRPKNKNKDSVETNNSVPHPKTQSSLL
tara:strand:+ start:221 stop:616 length:396 start_codon:yes stop_codon:yes gene_type:complete